MRRQTVRTGTKCVVVGGVPVLSDHSFRIRHLDQTKMKNSMVDCSDRAITDSDQMKSPFPTRLSREADDGRERRLSVSGEKVRPRPDPGTRRVGGHNKLKLGHVACAKAQYIRLDRQRGRNKETGVERRRLSGGKGEEKKHLCSNWGNRTNKTKTGNLNQVPPEERQWKPSLRTSTSSC